MTDHAKLLMHHEKRRFSEKEMLKVLLGRCSVATVCMHDEPYPYAVNMNYGFDWEEDLVFYFHMATAGHKLDLLRKNPNVSVTVYEFLDRIGFQPYRKETHDYRGLHAYGKAEIISPQREEEFIHGISMLQVNNGRKPIRKITDDMRKNLLLLRIRTEYVTGKAQYPIATREEVPIPPNQPLRKDG